jgi:hypothetical protein
MRQGTQVIITAELIVDAIAALRNLYISGLFDLARPFRVGVFTWND